MLLFQGVVGPSIVFLVCFCEMRLGLGEAFNELEKEQQSVSVVSLPTSLYSCVHHHPTSDQVIYDVDIEPSHLIHKRSIDQRLRIYLHYDDSIRQLPATHQLLIRENVKYAVDFWEDTLMVRATNAVIKLNRQCLSSAVRYRMNDRHCVGGCTATTKCGDIAIPEDHLQRCLFWNDVDNSFGSMGGSGAGVTNADFILYVAALDSRRCRLAKTIAYAAHCQQEQALDRPVAGYFSICPDSISTNEHDQKQLLSTIKHEILHALGFTAGLYAFYRDSQGNPLTPRNPLTKKPNYNAQLHLYEWSNNVVREVSRHDWRYRLESTTKKVNMIVTPRVVAEVRRHFNCSTLEGAELEDQGIDGTVLTHWEKRVFENEAMTGTYTQNPVISRITLALMEDTGWYRVKYENAEELEWGQNLGCDFVKKSCYEWIYTKQQRNEDIHPFCTEVKHGRLITDCTNNRHAVAICNLIEHPASLPSKYQYFKQIYGVPAGKVSRFGGSVSLADYCPYLQEFTWKDGETIVRGSNCLYMQNNIDRAYNYFGEKYSQSSRCFKHGKTWLLQHCSQQMRPDHSGSGCYQFECSRSEGLIIYVAGKRNRCFYSGYNMPVSYVSGIYLHTGSLVCPSCQEVCSDMGVMCPPDVPAGNIHSVSFLEAPCSKTNSIFSTVVLQIICYLNIANFITFLL